jgi:hypothetical protein
MQSRPSKSRTSTASVLSKAPGLPPEKQQMEKMKKFGTKE